MDLEEIARRVEACMEREHIQEQPFRCMMAGYEVGQLSPYVRGKRGIVNADKYLNFGQAVVQLFGLAYLRNVSLDKVVRQRFNDLGEAVVIGEDGSMEINI